MDALLCQPNPAIRILSSALLLFRPHRVPTVENTSEVILLVLYPILYTVCQYHVSGPAMFSSKKPLYVRRNRVCAIKISVELRAPRGFHR